MEEFETRDNTQESNGENTEETAKTADGETEGTAGIADAEKESEENSDENSGKSVLNDILEILESVVISVFVVLMLFTYIARPVTVDGRSMEPTLYDQDKLIMRTLFYTPKVGDIVIIDNQKSYTYNISEDEVIEGQGLEKRIIKRVIALGGQEVDIDFETGVVTVDGKQLEEDYIFDLTKTNARAFDYPVKVPEGYIFVMGDNRNNSTDSRSGYVGFVKEEDVLGEAIMRFYPFNKMKLLD